MIQTHLLPNNIRLIHKQIPSKVSHLGFFLNVGAREEMLFESGVAHAIEHSLFKGTQKRKGIHIIKRIEDVGGDMNAYTTKEETVFHVSFLAQYYDRMLELFSDLLYHAAFPEKEIEIEKEVILEEIRSYEDMPSELIFDDFESLIFGVHPLGNSILGTQKSVKHLKRNTILDFYKKHYTNDNIVIASEGNMDFKKLIHQVQHYFCEPTPNIQTPVRIPFEPAESKTLQVKKRIQQSHCILGNLAYSIKDEKRIPFYFLNNILGGPGMNSRLNLALREKTGLAYNVESNYNFYSDCGLFTIYFSTEHTQLEECLHIIKKTLKQLQEQKLGTLQLSNAKTQLIGQLAIANESNLNDMLSMGRSFLHQIPLETEEEIYRKLEVITAEELLEIANEQFNINALSTLIYSK